MSATLSQQDLLYNIILYRPQIPPNTGNIARLAVGTNCRLHLIGPLGFSLDDKSVRRAGLDFWDLLDYRFYPDFDTFLNDNHDPKRIFLITKFGKKSCWEHDFQKYDYFLFGRETKGLSESIMKKYSFYDQKLFIPMPGPSRSINLSNSVSIVIYEGLRQLGITDNFFTQGYNNQI